MKKKTTKKVLIIKDAVVNQIGLPVVILGKKLNSIQFNKKAAESFKGITSAEEFMALMGTDSAKRFRKIFDHAIKSGKEKSLTLPFKKYHWSIKLFPGKAAITLVCEKLSRADHSSYVLQNRMILDAMGDSFMLTDKDQNIIDVNPAICKALGYSRDELLTMNAGQFDKFISREEIRAIHRLADKKPVIFDTKNINADGKTVDAEVNMFAVRINGKKYYGSFGRNITEYKRVQTELEITNKRLSDITNSANDALWELDIATGERWANEIHQKLYGLTTNDPMPDGKEWEKHIHPEDRKEVVKTLDTAINAKHHTWNAEYRFRTGRNKWIYIYDRTLLHFGEDGKLEKMMGSMVDVTELKIIQDELEVQRNFSESIINALPGIFYLLDKDGNFLRWNKNFETITGYSSEEITSMNPYDFFYSRETDKLSNKIDEVFQKGWAEMEGTLLSKSGEGKPYYLSGWRTVVDNKECLIGTGVDLSEIKNAQENIKRMELKIAEQKIQDQKVISRAIISAQEKERNHIGKELHDNVNQLLAGTRLYLTMGGKKNPEIAEMLKYPIELLDNGIQEIRALTHRHISPAKDVDLKQLAEGIVELLKAASIKCELKYSLDLNIPENLMINIYRILQEQVTNILKHSAAKKVTFNISSNEGSVFLTTTDDGKGFDINKQREGIGISNIFNRVESYNGIIEIKSSPGNGCTIDIQIPVPDYMYLLTSYTG